MTRAIHGHFLKDDGSVISDHLRNHVHLTNCIHLKNHMHRHSPILAESSLMKDLLVLQRSRSLRDPSTRSPSWQTHSIIDSLARTHEKDDSSHGRRRSLGLEHPRERRQLSTSSLWLPSMSKADITAAATSSEQVDKGRHVAPEVARKEGEFSTRSGKSDLRSGSRMFQESLNSGKIPARRKPTSQKRTCGLDIDLKMLPEKLKVQPNITDTETAKNSQNFHHGKHPKHKVIPEDPRCSNRGLSRVKRHKFKAIRRAHGSKDLRDPRGHKDFSVAPNSLGREMHHNYHLGGEDINEMEETQTPRNGCGIPWNWSRIHHTGKTFLDIAGRSLSCGLSDSRTRKSGHPITHGQSGKPGLPVPGTADQSCSSTQSDSDALPLLNDDACGSQGSAENPFLIHDYSGELGIFAGHNGQDSDLSSERITDDGKSRRHHHSRLQSLTQKYMPRTFENLVGQNLVVQALSNAVLRERIGLIYVLYGPQGTGKSSCARVFARALNCQSLERTKPCGTCSSCISYDLGKSRNVLEVGPVVNFDFESIVEVFGNSLLGPLSSHYRVFIVDDCDTLPTDSWSSISKVIDQASQHVVFILVCTSLDHLPHIITSRCQKFFFPKLKDSDIIYKLQWIASKEGLEVHRDALKLIASRSDGSMRDAEMTLDQLSLLGQTISLNLVQELVGLVADDKLVDLLDLALSADTVNTVKSLREIMEAGVEPLALMSQLATIITDILAGSYVFTKERLRRRFFRRPTLSKEEMEKLRQALKTLSESEKQLRMSNDKLTWLTAALLQLAPDQQYILPNSSADTSFSHSPMLLTHTTERDLLTNTNMLDSIPNNEKGLSGVTQTEQYRTKGGNKGIYGTKASDPCTSGISDLRNPLYHGEINQAFGHNLRKDYINIEKIWKAVIERIQINALKHFMNQEGRLLSVNFGAAPTVQLMFSSNTNKTKAENFRGYILQAFESVLCTGVTLEIRCATGKGSSSEIQIPHNVACSGNGSSQMIGKRELDSNESAHRNAGEGNFRRLSKDKIVTFGPTPGRCVHSASHEKTKSEIIEILASPTKIQQTVGTTQCGDRGCEHGWQKGSSSHHQATFVPTCRSRDNVDQPRGKSLVRGKVSLAHVIQQAEGCTQRSGLSSRKPMSIADKLEQENLRLEPRARNLFYRKASRYTRRKLLHLRARTKRPRSLLKLMCCGRCSCGRIPR